MKKLFVDPDFELIRIGLVASVTTDSTSEEDNVEIGGELVPTESGGGGFIEDW